MFANIMMVFDVFKDSILAFLTSAIDILSVCCCDSDDDFQRSTSTSSYFKHYPKVNCLRQTHKIIPY